MSEREEAFGIPQPPEIEKACIFRTANKIGIPILFLIPILKQEFV